MTSTEKLLRALIALPSVNPAFVPAGHKLAGEQNMAEFLATVGARAGLDVELQTVLPNRPNLIARLAPRGTAKQRILLAPHLDTVPAEDLQFEPTTKQGRLHGRGAAAQQAAEQNIAQRESQFETVGIEQVHRERRSRGRSARTLIGAVDRS